MKKLFIALCVYALCAIAVSCSSDSSEEIDNLTPDIASVAFSFTADKYFNTVTLLDYAGSRFVQSIDLKGEKGKVVLNHGTHKIVAIANDFGQGDIYIDGWKTKKGQTSESRLGEDDTVYFWQSVYNPRSNTFVSKYTRDGYKDEDGWYHSSCSLTIDGSVFCKIFELTVSGDVSIPIEVRMEPISGILDIVSTDKFLTDGIYYKISNLPNSTNPKDGYSDYEKFIDYSYVNNPYWPYKLECYKEILLPEEGIDNVEFVSEVKIRDGEGNSYWMNRPPKFSLRRGYVTRLRGPILTDNGSNSDWTVEMIPFSDYR